MGIGSDVYNLFVVLHLLAVVAAFGPLFVLPRLRAADPAAAARIHLVVVLPATVLVWVFGMGLTGLSDDVFELTDPWIAASLGIWVVLMVVQWFGVRGALTGRVPARTGRAAIGASHLLYAAGIVSMVFKPGA
ncbi:MAG: hypothetical protein ACKO91_19355 [Acidimicrobiales bacterium]